MSLIQMALPALNRLAQLFLVPLQWIAFQWTTFKLGINHAYIKDMYARLCVLDWYDFVKVGEYEIQAFGQTVHVKRDEYEFTINENQDLDQIYVHERYFNTTTAPVAWEEVYRTNRALLRTRFINELVWLDTELEKAADSLPESDSTQV
jgi:hypothetical protein